jgi:hypothetical protein
MLIIATVEELYLKWTSLGQLHGPFPMLNGQPSEQIHCAAEDLGFIRFTEQSITTDIHW